MITANCCKEDFHREGDFYRDLDAARGTSTACRHHMALGDQQSTRRVIGTYQFGRSPKSYSTAGDPFAQLPAPPKHVWRSVNRFVRDDSAQSLGSLPLDGAACEAYNEDAFRYFLAVERKRAERSSRSLLLLLVDKKSTDSTPSDAMTGIEPSVASKLFSALSRSVRDVDFVGWYREPHVAGALLTQGADIPGDDAFQRIHERVNGALTDCLPPHAASALQVRVLQLRPGIKG